MKKKDGIKIIVLIFLLFIFGYLVNTQYAIDRSGRNSFLHKACDDADLKRIDYLVNMIEKRYKNNGYITRSIDELEKTDYYPYVKGTASSMFANSKYPWHQSRIEIKCEDYPDHYLFSGITHVESNNKVQYSKVIFKQLPLVQTKKRISFILQGRTTILKSIDEVRNFYNNSIYSLMYHDTLLAPIYTVKPISKCKLDNDFPNTNNELKEYLEWIVKIEGQQSLVDAWGHKFKIEIVKKILIIKSSGADGVWGTPDDIKLNKLLSN